MKKRRTKIYFLNGGSESFYATLLCYFVVCIVNRCCVYVRIF